MRPCSDSDSLHCAFATNFERSSRPSSFANAGTAVAAADAISNPRIRTETEEVLTIFISFAVRVPNNGTRLPSSVVQRRFERPNARLAPGFNGRSVRDRPSRRARDEGGPLRNRSGWPPAGALQPAAPDYPRRAMTVDGARADGAASIPQPVRRTAAFEAPR